MVSALRGKSAFAQLAAGQGRVRLSLLREEGVAGRSPELQGSRKRRNSFLETLEILEASLDFRCFPACK